MLRSLVCGLAVALLANVSAAEEKKDKTVSGTFVSYKDGTLTIKVVVRKGEEAKAQEFKVADDVKVTTFDGDTKKEAAAKTAFTAVKEGTPVAVTVGEGDKVTAVQVGVAKKPEKPAAKTKTVGGAFASYKDGTLTIKVKDKTSTELKSQEFKVAEDVKVTTFDGDAKKEGTAKDAFKDVKEGTAIAVTLGEGDKVTAVQVGAAKKKEKE